MIWRRLAWRLVLFVALGWPILPGPPGAHAQEPTPTPRGNVLFEDDFATYSRRWQETKSPKALVVYQDSALRLRIVSPGVDRWTVPDLEIVLVDYDVQVSAVWQAGSPDAQFGIVLDYTAGDGERFYALVVTVGGQWAFWRYEDGDWFDLTPPDAKPVKFEAGAAPVRLRVDVTGNTFTLYVNGDLAGEVGVDAALAGGVFGLIARAEHGFIDVFFDDMEVLAKIGEDEP